MQTRTRCSLVPVFLLAAHAIMQCETGVVPEPHCVAKLVPEEDIGMALFALSLVVYCHMVYHLIQEPTTVLGIQCFRVK